MTFLVDVELEQDQDQSLLIGAWDDLEYLVELLNGAWESVEYRLEKVPGGEDFFLFIEDPIREDEYECGIVERREDEAYAFSDAVHEMVMKAYMRYVEEFGEIETMEE